MEQCSGGRRIKARAGRLSNWNLSIIQINHSLRFKISKKQFARQDSFPTPLQQDPRTSNHSSINKDHRSNVSSYICVSRKHQHHSIGVAYLVIDSTGASGYIGGNTLIQIAEKHPEWTVNALVRDDSSASVLRQRFPSVNFVIGALESRDILVAESSKADVVLSSSLSANTFSNMLTFWIDLASSDDIPAINSYLEGLSRRPQSANRYLIHTSGTGMLADFSTGEGNEASKVYSDVADVKEIISLPLTHFHRDVDNAVISGGQAKNVKTAIVSPPTIYGVGKGPLKKRSIQVPALIAGILSRGKGFTVGEGQSIWDLVHIDDLGAAYVLLVEEALKENGSRATWGPEGYYFVETGEFVSDPRICSEDQALIPGSIGSRSQRLSVITLSRRD